MNTSTITSAAEEKIVARVLDLQNEIAELEANRATIDAVIAARRKSLQGALKLKPLPMELPQVDYAELNAITREREQWKLENTRFENYKKSVPDRESAEDILDESIEALAMLADDETRLTTEISALTTRIDSIDRRTLASFMDVLRGKRGVLAKELGALQTELKTIPARRDKAMANKAAAASRLGLATVNDDETYESVELTQQQVVISLDDTSTVTIAIPATPEDPEFSVSLRLRLPHDEDRFALSDLLDGSDKEVDGIFQNLEDHLLRGDLEIYPSIIPMTLESVESGGQKRFRFPKAFLDQFGDKMTR